jgi:hypothetical protein
MVMSLARSRGSERRRVWALMAAALLGWAICGSALAVPSFARQTGQSCVACHAGGQFPELTPYGRMFKLTGYTMGERTNPLALMVVASDTMTQKNDAGSGTVQSQLDNQAILDFASIFLAGKVSDNVGGFAQYTYSFYDSQDTNTGNWKGRLVADNFDVRYADRQVDEQRDLIWGVTLHNNPTVQDVWNSTPAWGYPYVSTTHGAFGSLPASTLVEGGLAQHVAGVGGYFYLNRNIYGELTAYTTAKGNLSFLSYGNQPGDPNNALIHLDGNSLYWRLAYTKDWGAHNLMLGALGMEARLFQNDTSTYLPLTGIGSTHYQDVGLDAQYQYLLAPHTLTAHFRTVHERIDDATGMAYSDGPATLNSTMAKVAYVYRDRYGASVAYTTVSGSADSTAYSSSAQLIPDSDRWTPELFWLPSQNVRVGAQFNIYTRYLGASSNYDGAGRNAADNNTTYLYLWLAY